MSDLILTPALGSGFAVASDIDRRMPPGVTIQERTDVSLCSVLARKSCVEPLATAVRQEFGIELPLSARYESREGVGFAWAGPHQWLAIAEKGESRLFDLRLRRALSGVASIVDQSDGRSVVRISGSRVRDALAKGVLIDLHPRVFKAGDTAMTLVAYINVQFWQVDEAPTYDFVMFRSFALAFCEWLADAAAEYGVAASDANASATVYLDAQSNTIR